MIQFDKVTKNYDSDLKALHNVTLTINQGECFGVVGESGSGKSTFLRLLNQLERPTSGTITVAQQVLATLSERDIKKRQQQIGMIFQQFNLLHNQTVAQNVALPLKLRGKMEPARVLDMLAFVNLTHKADAYPRELSGGEKQRVAIARALVIEPKLLLCDEPTSALDAQHVDEVLSLLEKIHSQFQTTMVIVSHELAVIKRMCQRAAIFNRGELVGITAVKSAENAQQYDSYEARAMEILQQ
ncbi:methionine ABC transporter ATP-binding protein [Brochothrix campestris]|uniref:ABC transporter n=1 Tax=Brochothrix campestris FSL F6-1037 TaxID=1265861 RepID=W7D9S3_9LIST|nr:ATP-binding cassette domain-containing protein [Brochothrix campestris]EUJ42008.1 ABC transporter [Brochothrix campestris FSL F6-1037]